MNTQSKFLAFGILVVLGTATSAGAQSFYRSERPRARAGKIVAKILSTRSRQQLVATDGPATAMPSAAGEAANATSEQLTEKPSTETVIGVQVGVLSRALAFSQDVYGRLRPLTVNAQVVAVDVEAYPEFRSSALKGKLGVFGRAEILLAGMVRDQDLDSRYSAKHTELILGLTYRQPLGSSSIALNVAANRLSAGLKAAGQLTGVPDVDYTSLRLGLNWRTMIARATLDLIAGFRLPIDYGSIADKQWFPRVGGYGADLRAAVSYPLGKSIALTSSGSWTRFLLEANSQPEDAFEGQAQVAGGATDTYLAAYLGLQFTP